MKLFNRSLLSLFLWSVMLLIGVMPALPTLAVDYTLTAGNVVPGANARYRYGVSGAAITAGQLVYLDVLTNTWKLSDANVVAAADVDGISISSVASGVNITVVAWDDDLTLGVTTNTVLAKGQCLILSATPGAFAPFADIANGMYLIIPAIGKSTTKVVFNAEGLRNTVVQP
ncbi:MAG: hypothetical protein V4662_13685 [Verrucomicrobiota bacterium]